MLRFPALLLCLVLAACGTEPDDVPAVAPGAAPVTSASVEVAPADSATMRAYEDVVAYARAENLAEQPFGEIVTAIGLQFLEAPYVEGMLDENAEEVLVVDLLGFDCVTYVENAVALAQSVVTGEPTYESYVRNLEALRYRGGTLDGYCSRLHYFTDWMRDNAERGNVELVTRDFGEPFDKTIDFMSTHRDAYPKLADGTPRSDSLYACLQQVEADLADHEIYFVPQEDIASIYDQLRTGDIIATATGIDGLDVTHTGFVLKRDGQTNFLHASLSGEVKVSDDLASYVQGVDAQTGIIVARPLPNPTGASTASGASMTTSGGGR
jgi:hypothetical protein